LLINKDSNLNPASPFVLLLRSTTPFCCAPLHHNQSRVSNLSGTELITLGLCSYDRSRTCIRYVTSCCSYQGRFHREQGSCYSLFTTPFI
jgi:hypothetical protein